MRRQEINPQPNAVIEQLNQTLFNMLSKCLDQNKLDGSTLV